MLSPAVASVAAATAATAATATATAIAAAAAAMAAAAPEATATATAATLRTLFRLVHAERATVEVRAVHRLDGLLGLGRRPHRHEPEATRLTRRTIGHDVDVRDLADAREGLAYGLSGGRKRQVADIQTRSHVSLFSRLRPRVRLRSARPSTWHPIDRRKSEARPRWRNPPRRHVALPSIASRGPEVERAVVAGETSVSKSKHNGPNCPRKLFAERPRALQDAPKPAAQGTPGTSARALIVDGLSSSSIFATGDSPGASGRRARAPGRDCCGRAQQSRFSDGRARTAASEAGRQGMGLANFAGSGAGWSVSIFCRAMTPPVGSLTMSDTTVFATL